MEPGQHGLYIGLQFCWVSQTFTQTFNAMEGWIFWRGLCVRVQHVTWLLRYSPDEDSCASMASGHWTKTCPFLTMFSDLVIQKGIWLLSLPYVPDPGSVAAHVRKESKQLQNDFIMNTPLWYHFDLVAFVWICLPLTWHCGTAWLWTSQMQFLIRWQQVAGCWFCFWNLLWTRHEPPRNRFQLVKSSGHSAACMPWLYWLYWPSTHAKGIHSDSYHWLDQEVDCTRHSCQPIMTIVDNSVVIVAMSSQLLQNPNGVQDGARFRHLTAYVAGHLKGPYFSVKSIESHPCDKASGRSWARPLWWPLDFKRNTVLGGKKDASLQIPFQCFCQNSKAEHPSCGPFVARQMWTTIPFCHHRIRHLLSMKFSSLIFGWSSITITELRQLPRLRGKMDWARASKIHAASHTKGLGTLRCLLMPHAPRLVPCGEIPTWNGFGLTGTRTGYT